MSDEFITFVNMVIVPGGLMAIMFSLGLSLTVADFRRLIEAPRPVTAGLLGQLLVLPMLGTALAVLFRLPPEMAVGLIILSVCPGGVTSNAVAFAARANVALSVSLTAISSLVTVMTTPLLIGLALGFYYDGVNAPSLSIPDTIAQLFRMTALPVALGMTIRWLLPKLATALVPLLRPVSMLVLAFVIGFSVYVSAELVWANIVTAGPAAWVLNVCAMAAGLVIARAFALDGRDTMTIGIEVGVQNATMAMFLSLTVLGSLELAITPILYGVIMIVNAAILVRLLRMPRVIALLTRQDVQ
ncbi:MAG: bile acid:sodium symporter family protein [Sphingomonadales bacterium]